ncbi:MAG: hypothetical protein AAF708_20770 [Deinococcota bacterium]
MANYTKTYVGFGFGPIQVGLFVEQALLADTFERIVIGYRRADIVADIRATRGYIGLNIAHADRIEQVLMGPIEVLNIYDATERAVFVEALSQADEAATALSSVVDYTSLSPTGDSIAAIFADGLALRAQEHLQQEDASKPLVVYTAENHNRAAEHLHTLVWSRLQARLTAAQLAKLESTTAFLNTVIGKMSGLVTIPEAMRGHLAPITAGKSQAFLVEAFDDIFVSASPFRRQLAFSEKPQLQPFEEAKLYGHNATHALAAYLAQVLEVRMMANLRDIDGIVPWLLDAFVQESGAALIRKYKGLDPLFTLAGYSAYAEDLLQRMTNPFLRDSSVRVGRDPKRKLGWHDRFVGVIRLSLSQQVDAGRYAFGCCAALDVLGEQYEVLEELWQPDAPDERNKAAVLELITLAWARYQQWQAEGRPALDVWWANATR